MNPPAKPTPSLAGDPKPGIKVWLCLVLISAGLVLWHLHYGFICFQGMDGGVLINSAWQQYKGAIPYRDFDTSMPPLFLLGAGWAFKIMGPTWLSLTVLVCIFSSLTFVWMFFLFWKMTEHSWTSLILSLSIQCLTLLPTSWWWYNAMTAVMEALFFGSMCALLVRPADLTVRCSFIASEALLGLSKENMAGVLIPLSLLFLVFQKDLRTFALKATLMAFVLDVGFLALNRITLPDLLFNYLNGPTGRLTSLWMWMANAMYFYVDYEKQTSLVLLAFLTPAVCIGILQGQSPQHYFRVKVWALFYIASITMVIGFGTNNNRKAEEAVCLVILIPFIARHLPCPQRIGRAAHVFACTLLFVMSVEGLWFGYSRRNFLEPGTVSYSLPEPLLTLRAPPLFEGLEVSTVLQVALQDMDKALRDNGVLGNRPKKVFFGPFIDFSYAVFNLSVEPGLPIWWERVPSSHHGEKYPFGNDMPLWISEPSRWIPAGEKLDFRVQNFINAKFDLCLFLRGPEGLPEMDYMPADLRAELYENYQLEYLRRIAVFKRKE